MRLASFHKCVKHLLAYLLLCTTNMLSVIEGLSVKRHFIQRTFLCNKYFAGAGIKRTTIKMDCSTYVDMPTIGHSKNQVVIIAGATSVGKSAVAQEVCSTIKNAEIIIADSVQVYKHLDIGSNKPSVKDMLEVPHHMVDICEPSEQLSTGDFSRRAAHIIREILARGKVPVVVGGSTMWVEWLVKGIPDAPKVSTETTAKAKELLKTADAEENWDEAIKILQVYNIEQSRKIARNDWYRLQRYLEIGIDMKGSLPIDNSSTNNKLESDTGKDEEASASSASSVDKNLTGQRTPLLEGLDVRCFFLCDNRELVYHTIDSRCEMMLEAGLIPEVESLLTKGLLKEELPVAKSIGYRQTIDYLTNEHTESYDIKAFDEFLSAFATATRNYAQRQMKWYRKDHNFLFLRINRNSSRKVSPVANSSSISNSNNSNHYSGSVDNETNSPLQTPLKYGNVVKELLHWCAVSREQYQRTLCNQVDNAVVVSELRKKKKFPLQMQLTGDLVERLTVAMMVAEGVVSLPDRKLLCDGEGLSTEQIEGLAGSWANSINDSTQGVTPQDVLGGDWAGKSPWTADDNDIRMDEGVMRKKQNQMKYFRSRIKTNDYEKYERFILQGDRARKLVLERTHQNDNQDTDTSTTDTSTTSFSTTAAPTAISCNDTLPSSSSQPV